MKKWTSIVFMLLMMVAADISFAETPEVETAGDYAMAMGTKIGRGLENVVTSPAEIPCTMSADMHRGNSLAGFFTGLGKGTAFFLRRVLVGVTEVGTFMIPMERTIPRVCYEPTEVG